MGGHPVFHPTPLTQCLGLGSSGKASELGPPGGSWGLSVAPILSGNYL